MYMCRHGALREVKEQLCTVGSLLTLGTSGQSSILYFASPHESDGVMDTRHCIRPFVGCGSNSGHQNHLTSIFIYPLSHLVSPGEYLEDSLHLLNMFP